MTDSAGGTQATYAYDPYGGLASSAGSITNTFRFAGEYLDVESGLYYVRARYYEAITGQFLSVDPPVKRTRDPYTYAAGSPLNSTDPSGLACGWLSLNQCNWGAAWNVASTQVPQIRPTENNDPNYDPWNPLDIGYLVQQNVRELSNPSDWGSANAYRVATTLGATYVGARLVGGVISGAGRLMPWMYRSELLGRAGPVFGSAKYRNGVWGCANRGFIRIGWSGKAGTGDVFRVAVGEDPTWFHIDIWNP